LTISRLPKRRCSGLFQAAGIQRGCAHRCTLGEGTTGPGRGRHSPTAGEIRWLFVRWWELCWL